VTEEPGGFYLGKGVNKNRYEKNGPARCRNTKPVLTMTLNIRGKDITAAGILSEWFESEKVIYIKQASECRKKGAGSCLQG
jgi:hypothetical protein